MGMAFLAIFMLAYYRLSGLNAIVALTANLIILLGAMAYTGATLTLPGIAGVILTIGVGVDTNVLIFERIREELRNGKTVRAAINNGFERVWITMLIGAGLIVTFIFHTFRPEHPLLLQQAAAAPVAVVVQAGAGARVAVAD